MPALKHLFSVPRPRAFDRRAQLRDLYVFGILSVFRRPSLLRVQPIPKSPRRSSDLVG